MDTDATAACIAELYFATCLALRSYDNDTYMELWGLVAPAAR
ncbi:MAG: hypothetical protein ACI9JM_000386 [Halioglobus sp.]|jgi:hypothetical protein